MMNNKGVTLAEFLISFVFASVVLILLFQVVTAIREIYVGSGLKTQLLIHQAIISEKINKDLMQNNLSKVVRVNDNVIEFTFGGVIKKLEIDRTLKTVSYDDYTAKLFGDSSFGNLNVSSEMIGTSYILLVKLPIYSKLFAREDFGINTVYQYSSVINIS